MSSARVVPSLYRCLKRQSLAYAQQASKRGLNLEMELKHLSRHVIHGEPLTPPEGFSISDPMSTKAASAILKKVFRGCASPNVGSPGTQQALIGLGFKSLTYLANRTHVLETFPEEGEKTLETSGCQLTSKASYLGHYGNFVHGVHISMQNNTGQKLLLLEGELLTIDELLNTFKFNLTFEAKTRVVNPGEEYVMHFSKHVIGTTLGTVKGTLAALAADSGERLKLEIPSVLLSLTTPSSLSKDIADVSTKLSDGPTISDAPKSESFEAESSTSTSTSEDTPSSKPIKRGQPRECAGSTPTPL